MHLQYDNNDFDVQITITYYFFLILFINTFIPYTYTLYNTFLFHFLHITYNDFDVIIIILQNTYTYLLFFILLVATIESLRRDEADLADQAIEANEAGAGTGSGIGKVRI